MFSSPTASNVVTFQNPVNLNGSDRTIFVDDNTASANDWAVMSGVISGSAGIVKTGPGKLVLSAANTYTGTTTVSAGTLDFSTAPSLPGGSYAISGTGTLNIGTLSQSIGAFQITGGTRNRHRHADKQCGVRHPRRHGRRGPGRQSIALNKTGTATAILSGSDTYTGVTTISAGALQAGIGTSGMPANGINYNSPITLNGGVYQSNAAYTFNRTLASSGANTLPMDVPTAAASPPAAAR